MAEQKLKEALEAMINEEQERKFVWIGEMMIKKHQNQRIPYTEEEWGKEMEKQKRYKNRQLINYIDKVFFDDGALQMSKEKEKGRNQSTEEQWEEEIEKQKRYKDRQLVNYIDRVLGPRTAL